jgi:phosphate butyryltransferase
MITSLRQLLDEAARKAKKTVAVVQADDEEVLQSADEAFKRGLARFRLIAEPARLVPLLDKMGLAWAKDCIVPATDAADAARKGVQLVREGKSDALMKGNLQTGLFLKAVLDKEQGLRGDGLLSQCGVYENPLNGKLLFITDCAMNIAPDVMQKKQILENAVRLAVKLGIATPKVAVLAALENVNLDMPETVDAAVLSKMADRGQIRGCIVDGPFALDNALSAESAQHKGFSSPVAGDLDILLVPDIKTGNAVHKSIVFFTPIKNAANCLGAQAPVIMTSRADHMEIKLFSIALGCFVS